MGPHYLVMITRYKLYRIIRTRAVIKLLVFRDLQNDIKNDNDIKI